MSYAQLSAYISHSFKVSNTTSRFKLVIFQAELWRRLLTGWPCQYRSFNCYWQGHLVNSEFRTTADRVTLSITVETAVLTGLPCQYCITKHCWQGHSVNSDYLCITDRATMSTVHHVVDRVNNNQSGAKKCNQSEHVLHRFYPVSSGCDCVIDRVTLSEVGVDV